jgi:hypothetical protein
LESDLPIDTVVMVPGTQIVVGVAAMGGVAAVADWAGAFINTATTGLVLIVHSGEDPGRVGWEERFGRLTDVTSRVIAPTPAAAEVDGVVVADLEAKR